MRTGVTSWILIGVSALSFIAVGKLITTKYNVPVLRQVFAQV